MWNTWNKNILQIRSANDMYWYMILQASVSTNSIQCALLTSDVTYITIKDLIEWNLYSLSLQCVLIITTLTLTELSFLFTPHLCFLSVKLSQKIYRFSYTIPLRWEFLQHFKSCSVGILWCPLVHMGRIKFVFNWRFVLYLFSYFQQPKKLEGDWHLRILRIIVFW